MNPADLGHPQRGASESPESADMSEPPAEDISVRCRVILAGLVLQHLQAEVVDVRHEDVRSLAMILDLGLR